MSVDRNPWVGLDLAAEPVAWARLLRRAHDQAQAGVRAPAIVRELVTRSWERAGAWSAASGARPPSSALR